MDDDWEIKTFTITIEISIITIKELYSSIYKSFLLIFVTYRKLRMTIDSKMVTKRLFKNG